MTAASDPRAGLKAHIESETPKLVATACRLLMENDAGVMRSMFEATPGVRDERILMASLATAHLSIAAALLLDNLGATEAQRMILDFAERLAAPGSPARPN